MSAHKIKSLMLKHLPREIYQTWFEIQTMLEQVNEDIPVDSVRQSVYQLWADGLLNRRVLVTPVVDRPFRGLSSKYEYCLK